MSVNTVRKHICSLADKGLISTEEIFGFTHDGLKRNGTLRYTLQSFQKVPDAHCKVSWMSWRWRQQDAIVQKLRR